LVSLKYASEVPDEKAVVSHKTGMHERIIKQPPEVSESLRPLRMRGSRALKLHRFPRMTLQMIVP
jgi:hypothetical protein